MRFGIVHSYYRNLEKSGENNVVDAQIKVLKSKGHDVAIFASKYPEDKWPVSSMIRTGRNVVFGLGDNPAESLREFNPEAILLHNLFPNISSNWLEEFGEITFSFKHNYRDVCASANLYRNGSICMKCVEGSNLNALINRCYKDSMLMTSPIVVRNSLSMQLRKDLRYPKKVLFLSDEMARLHSTSGVPSERCGVITNFVFDEYSDWNFSEKKNGRWVAVGRMVAEKGFMELLEVWPPGIELDIFGDGPLLEKVEAASRQSPNVHIKGSIKREELSRLLPSYTGAVVPSRWFEPGALVILEFLSAGLPIVSMGIWSGAAGLNREWHLETESFDDNQSRSALLALIEKVNTNKLELSLRQRQKYLNSFTPDNWYQNLIEIMNSAGLKTK